MILSKFVMILSKFVVILSQVRSMKERSWNEHLDQYFRSLHRTHYGYHILIISSLDNCIDVLLKDTLLFIYSVPFSLFQITKLYYINDDNLINY